MQRARCGIAVVVVLAAVGCGESGDGPAPSPVPTSLTVLAGNAQSARYGTAVAVAPAVMLRDAEGAAIGGLDVTFSVTAGNGAVTGATARTSTTGVATAGSWTLGPVPGANVLRATIGTLGATITATGTIGPASSIAMQGGNGQSAPAGTTVAVPPSVLVTDGTYNVSDVDVTFVVTQGGGSVTPAVLRTGTDGRAQVASWQLGGAGPQTLTATASGMAPITFSAMATASTSNTIAKIAGDNTTAFAGNFTPTLPVVEVHTASGQLVPDVAVTFAITGGGGTASRTATTTNANGRATLGAWRFGASGVQTLTATIADAPPATFTGTATPIPPSQYDIEVIFLDPQPTAAQQAAFLAARDRWRQIIVGDVTDVGFGIVANGACGGFTTPAVPGPIDDVIIFARIGSIDGPSHILAQAGPCLLRDRGQLAYAGVVSFDIDDLDYLGSLGNGLSDVAFHEFGHVLGFGTIWSNLGVLISPGTADVAFTGTAGRQAYAAMLSPGSTVATGADVPVENCAGYSPSQCGLGTRDGHWREPVFTSEIMTGFYNSSGTNPFSAVSAASMRDLAYVVNDAATDAFTLPLVLGGFRSGAAIDRPFREELAPWPMLLVDAAGRIVGEIRR